MRLTTPWSAVSAIRRRPVAALNEHNAKQIAAVVMVSPWAIAAERTRRRGNAFGQDLEVPSRSG